MPVVPECFKVEVPEELAVSALSYSAPGGPARLGVTLLLAHGAGAGQTSGFMVAFASGLAARGIDVVTFNFSYTERGRRIPDPPRRLEACYRAALASTRARAGNRDSPVAIGGKSLGGRIASHLAVATELEDLVGLVCLGYPLHPPGRPEKRRVAHLPDIRVPMLVVQGTRDTFGTPDELRPWLAPLGRAVTLHEVAGGDHSFKVPKRGPVLQSDVYDHAQDAVAGWLHRQIARPRP